MEERTRVVRRSVGVPVTLTPTRERQSWHASATKWAWIQISFTKVFCYVVKLMDCYLTNVVGSLG